MKISVRASIVKFISSILPSRFTAGNFSARQITLDLLEKLWKLSRSKIVIFRRGLTVENIDCDGVVCEWLYKKPEQKKKILFFLHAGAYLKGGLSGARHRSMNYPINTNASLFVVAYRTTPVAGFPAAYDDAMAAYRYVCRNMPDSEIIVMGDSAGGGLALSTVRGVLDEGLKAPVRVILNSPWTNLTCTGESYVTLNGRDCVLSETFLRKCARLYAGNNLEDPRVSPLFADYTGFPPMNINVGSDEILLSDSLGVGERAREAGAEATVRVWDGMFHMFHYFGRLFPESGAVREEIYNEIDRS